MTDFPAYWSRFDQYIRANGAGYNVPTSPTDRARFYVRWSGMPHCFQLAACGPRKRKGTSVAAVSVELIRDGTGSSAIEMALLQSLPRVRVAWGDDLDHRPGGRQFKLDASLDVVGQMEEEIAQFRWLLAGVIRLDLIFRPILSTVAA